jgi:hypothetical protein
MISIIIVCKLHLVRALVCSIHIWHWRSKLEWVGTLKLLWQEFNSFAKKQQATNMSLTFLLGGGAFLSCTVKVGW